ncbi:GDP-mannose-dependent alpha-(1-2)-phosphatidylinositol mannosyltransferase [Rubrobacter xylanophilus]|uniref:GDP-mannose-dependent alpha-(1-2)-phosphatidylinositol mannosyltransferase n=1 Tax=Rubrobacter xylanophilus TaxID=49319 RepID=A0A510HJ43_9ACTN|nr:glycosyltransferase family 4 protein [Rubrobacter xylanophilus]BBL79938.1 GDP-mannose-dependent alpha-(1-2)-phosphatidylinositol mannosyltransferase [Rubrobacter xylanophilus]
MRVCLVSPYSWSFPGGVLEHVDALACQLERRGHEVRVLAPNDPLDLRTRLLHPRLGRHHPPPERVVPVGRSLPFPANGSLANIAFSPRVWGTVRRAVKALRPDVIHVHEPLAPMVSLAALAAAEELRLPVVGTFHANYPEGSVYCRIFRVARALLDPTDRIGRVLCERIAVSPAAAASAGRYFRSDCWIIPNGVDVERFSPPPGLGRRPGEVLFVGRPVPRKGLPVLLEAFGRVLDAVPGARLVIVGSRPEDVDVPKRLLSSVEVRGVVDGEGLVRAMHSAEVLCAPSTGRESFGMVLVEAMAAGLPVVASDIPGYDRVITHGRDGLLFPPGDPEALAAALTGLLKNPTLRKRLAAAGLRTARRYDWNRVAGEVERVYRAALAR